ncbi:mannitol-1-phosphate 5-dehydrogenase [Pseudalkalibacillus salsuginis]|uniref:mannitol-1-phosphate 5-dehydrogenase n=1 Tax=Pseudalkalibacillus salsuginis TaxID=2910972 RepID=UPI001F39F5DF|nr:mannitol-1-phosphate 5-dehydrogenase [Pseudalkalibacillus salsuginis]MCF6410183.1 mannitol-1-phosphate 5-dehydrogenase [Pseudalkalibacillus salsuginis]
MLAIHFGAGNIGRGFIGALLGKAGFQTVFVDVNAELIDELNRRGSYTIELVGNDETIEVNGISGLNSLKDPEAVINSIAEADLITTAVGPDILPIISDLLGKGLQKRLAQGGKQLNVIACENMIGGSTLLKDYVYKNIKRDTKHSLEDIIGFPDAAVDRIVPLQTNDDPLLVKVEPYYEWVVETKGMKGAKPDIAGITFVDDLTPYIERKLFTVNTGHAAAAYLGYRKGYQTIKEAMEDRIIQNDVRRALQESGEVLIRKYQFRTEEHQAYIERIIGRFLNPHISDEVTRVARAPKRKLGANDRLVGPAIDYLELVGKNPIHLGKVIAAALCYDHPDDDEAMELQDSIQKLGFIETFKKVAGLNDFSRLLMIVKEQLDKLNR